MLPAPLLLTAVLTAPLLASGAPTLLPTPAQEAGERAPQRHPDHDDVVATVDRLKRALRRSTITTNVSDVFLMIVSLS